MVFFARQLNDEWRHNKRKKMLIGRYTKKCSMEVFDIVMIFAMGAKSERRWKLASIVLLVVLALLIGVMVQGY
ncbi:MAG: hypothetical protein ACMZI0_05120 [Symbiopectobacterium sp.]|uniref:hypothetical protein n=1 Tax=Symbiopectobacterium sp. TaxID=2952789 RepID=UPI0039ECB074